MVLYTLSEALYSDISMIDSVDPPIHRHNNPAAMEWPLGDVINLVCPNQFTLRLAEDRSDWGHVQNIELCKRVRLSVHLTVTPKG